MNDHDLIGPIEGGISALQLRVHFCMDLKAFDFSGRSAAWYRMSSCQPLPSLTFRINLHAKFYIFYFQLLAFENAHSIFFFFQHLLPSMTVKAKQQGDEISVDKICDYWRVDNIFTFENIGFSNTVDNVKYLTCADCEIGPIGWHNISNEKSYVALARVLHK